MSYPDNPIFRGKGARDARRCLSNVISSEVLPNRLHLEPIEIESDARLVQRCAWIIRRGIARMELEGVLDGIPEDLPMWKSEEPKPKRKPGPKPKAEPRPKPEECEHEFMPYSSFYKTCLKCRKSVWKLIE